MSLIDEEIFDPRDEYDEEFQDEEQRIATGCPYPKALKDKPPINWSPDEQAEITAWSSADLADIANRSWLSKNVKQPADAKERPSAKTGMENWQTKENRKNLVAAVNKPGKDWSKEEKNNVLDFLNTPYNCAIFISYIGRIWRNTAGWRPQLATLEDCWNDCNKKRLNLLSRYDPMRGSIFSPYFYVLERWDIKSFLVKGIKKRHQEISFATESVYQNILDDDASDTMIDTLVDPMDNNSSESRQAILIEKEDTLRLILPLVEAYLSTIPEHKKFIFYARAIENKDFKYICEEMLKKDYCNTKGKPYTEQNIRTIYCRLLQALREYLQEHGVDLNDYAKSM